MTVTAIPAESTATVVLDLPVDALVDNPNNPRRDLGDLTSLADSIRSVGLLEPLVVVSSETYRTAMDEPTIEMADGTYVLIAGHRRRAAARLAGLVDVPCVLREDLTGTQARMAMLLENLERSDLTVLEEAQAYADLRLLDLSQDEIARRVGRSQSHISKRLDLLELPVEGQQLVLDKRLTLDDARVLLPLADQPKKLAELATADRPAWKSLKQLVDEQLKKDADAAAYKTTVDELKAKGVRVIKEPQGYAYMRGGGFDHDKRPAKIEALRESGRIKSVAKHRKLSCHAVVVVTGSRYYGGPCASQTVEVCTAWTTHEAPAATEVSVQEAEKQAAREAYQAQLAEHEAARSAFLTIVLSSKKPPKQLNDYLLEHLVEDLSQGWSAKTHQALALLGVDPSTVGETAAEARAIVLELAGSNTANLLRAAAALRIARDANEYHRQDAYTGLFTTLGYEAPGPEPVDPDDVVLLPCKFQPGDRVQVDVTDDRQEAGVVLIVAQDDDAAEWWLSVRLDDGTTTGVYESDVREAPAADVDGAADDPDTFAVGELVYVTYQEHQPPAIGTVTEVRSDADGDTVYAIAYDGADGELDIVSAHELQRAAGGCITCGCTTDGPCSTDGHCLDAEGFPSCEYIEGDAQCSNCGPNTAVETVQVAGEVL